MEKHSKLHKLLITAQTYLLGAVLLAVPLYPKFPFIVVPNTFVSIRIEDFLLLILGIVVGIYSILDFKNVCNSLIHKSIILFLLVGFVSVISAVLLTKSVNPMIGVLHWIRRIEYFIPFFAAYNVIQNDRARLYFYIKLLLIVVLITFIYGYGQKNFNWPIIITQNQEYSKGVALQWIPGSHINSTFAGHYDLATFLIFALPFLASSYVLVKGSFSKAMFASGYFAGLWLLINAISRISIVSYLISVTISLVFVKKYRYIPLILFISMVLFGTDAGLKTRYNRIIDVIKIRVESMTDSIFTIDTYAQETLRVSNVEPTPTQPPIVEDRSSSIRFQVEWPRALRALQKNPILGTGYSSITLATDNDYLRMLGEVGILGFLSFSLIFINITATYLKAFPLVQKFKGLELSFLASVIASLPGLFLNAVFIDIFEASKFAILFWAVTGMGIALVYNLKKT